MEHFHEAIRLGVVSHSPMQLGSEEVREVLPELRCELGSSVGGDIRKKAVTSNPSTQEGISHVFGTYAS